MQADSETVAIMDTDHHFESLAIAVGIVYCLAVIIWSMYG